MAINAATAQLIRKTFLQRQKKFTTLTRVIGFTWDSSIKLMVDEEFGSEVIENTMGFKDI
jgi:hypothetical protein